MAIGNLIAPMIPCIQLIWPLCSCLSNNFEGLFGQEELYQGPRFIKASEAGLPGLVSSLHFMAVRLCTRNPNHALAVPPSKLSVKPSLSSPASSKVVSTSNLGFVQRFEILPIVMIVSEFFSSLLPLDVLDEPGLPDKVRAARTKSGAHGGRQAPMMARHVSMAEAECGMMSVWLKLLPLSPPPGWKMEKRMRRANEASTTLVFFRLSVTFSSPCNLAVFCKLNEGGEASFGLLPATQYEDACRGQLLVASHPQIPDLANGQDHRHDVEYDVGNGYADVELGRIDAGGGNHGLVPEGFDGRAGEDCNQVQRKDVDGERCSVYLLLTATTAMPQPTSMADITHTQ